MKDFFFDLGPNLDYHFTKTDSFKKIGIGVGVGLGYDISNKLLFTTGYSFGLSNRLKNKYSGDSNNFKFNILQIGIGYKF